MTKLYQTIARTSSRQKTARPEALDKINAKKEWLNSFLPSGDAFINGSQIAWDVTSRDEIIILSSFALMDGKLCSKDNLFEFKVKITPSFLYDFNLTIEPLTSKDALLMRDCEGYVSQIFAHAMRQEVE